MSQHQPHNFDQQDECDDLERLLLKGINSGPATEMTREDWAGIMKRAERLAAARTAKKDPL
jgi:hypothetical protein